jgi:hypothetical protein
VSPEAQMIGTICFEDRIIVAHYGACTVFGGGMLQQNVI